MKSKKSGVKRSSKPRSAAKHTDSYHHGNLRETLIAAAVKFLEKNPLEKLSLRALASKAGVSQAAPYRHFKDRNAVLAAISQQGFEIKFQYMVEEYLKNRDDPYELIHSFAQSYFKMGLLHPQHFKLMLTSPVCPSPEYPELEKSAVLSFCLLKKTVVICQKAKVMGPGDPYHKSMHCWALVNGFTTLYTEGRLNWLGVTEQNAKAALRIYLDQFLSGQTLSVPENSGFQLFSTSDSEGHIQKVTLAETLVNQILLKK